ncbi:MAG: hypothetical protein Q9210_001943 [Variospora velana]
MRPIGWTPHQALGERALFTLPSPRNLKYTEDRFIQADSSDSEAVDEQGFRPIMNSVMVTQHMMEHNANASLAIQQASHPTTSLKIREPSVHGV